ncbi:MAG: SRPBCC family protein [Solirubrobacteraceae bacterium]
MPVTRRSDILPATPDRLWAIVSDPHHLPRWWPGVQRVEGVGDGRFTKVLVTRKGRAVRMDFALVADEPPARRRWAQELADTPFERLMAAAAEEVALAPAGRAGEATEVTLTLDRRLRGWSRFGGFFFRRAARTELDGALEGLREVVGG